MSLIFATCVKVMNNALGPAGLVMSALVLAKFTRSKVDGDHDMTPNLREGAIVANKLSEGMSQHMANLTKIKHFDIKGHQQQTQLTKLEIKFFLETIKFWLTELVGGAVRFK